MWEFPCRWSGCCSSEWGFFDAVTDPIIGLLSDRTRSRFGRRRPYIAVGSVFVAAALVLLFVPPQSMEIAAATVWFAVSIFALFFFWTVVVVPFESMGPEISLDYNERTALFGVRDGLLIAGTLAAASSPSMVLTKMTGVPLTEKTITEKRPEYRRYIETVPAFFPRMPKKRGEP
ncbi:MAG: MFS transporter [Desulfobacterales bacterium]|nr:MFS transporter [Desulfobacterales bacterium]